MSKLLLDEHPLLVMPELARRVGLNESIVLQQIHYWNEINKKAKNNFKDGYYWTFNTYEEWQKQFPFWSDRTIRRTFTTLEKYDLVIARNYNKLQIDRTKWYRINYEALENLEKYSFGQNGLFNWSDWHDQWIKMASPLPENNSKNKTKSNAQKTADLHPPTSPAFHFFSKDKNETVNQATEVLRYYYGEYQRFMKQAHPALKEDQLNRVYDMIMLGIKIGIEMDEWQGMIDIHLERSFRTKKNDLNVNAFASAKNFDILRERMIKG